jgi:hypothetical protein
MTFKRRDGRRAGFISATNYFQCDDYRGLNGPNDDGTCTMTDSRVVRHVKEAVRTTEQGER